MRNHRKLITRLLFLPAFVFGTFSIYAQALNLPRVSPPAELKQTIGLTEIVVNYSRPKVIFNGQDRTGDIWGKSAWYGMMKTQNGDLPWRAGANENTTISFSDDVKIQGKLLKAGKYGLQMIVYEDGKATVIFSNNSSLWGSRGYKQEEDALRINTNTEDIPFVNPLTYEFVDLGDDYGVLALSWEKKRIPFKIEINIKEAVLANIRQQLNSGKDSQWQALQTAAAYCAGQNTNHEEALTWINQSIKLNENIQNLSTKTQLLFQTGKQKEAIQTADNIVKIADINQLNSLAYTMLQVNEIDKAIEYFKLNVERNPEDANAHDSLGEGYMAKNDNKKAIESFKKALSLNPPQNVKDNSIANLKKLGVDYKDK